MRTSTKLFGVALRDLLIEREVTTPMGNPDWAGFAQLLPDIQYESLRKAVTGERIPSPKIIEAVSDALSIDPTAFVEYRLQAAQRAFDPRVVSLDSALATLTQWEAFHQSQRNPSRG
jgi:hypothetical protein